jgi:hydroxymethylpyrimidine pyrophosphatase-like HAD family hydrolase
MISRGIIALDIDGTLTAEAHIINQPVIDLLISLYDQGWKIVFITGRSFMRGHRVLQSLPFPYYFAVQNGALLFEMPSCRIVSKKMLKHELIAPMEKICLEEGTDFIVYSGFENQDICYHRGTYLSPRVKRYLETRIGLLKENWLEVSSFKNLPIDYFTSFKCFVEEKNAYQLSERIEREILLHAPANRDSFDPSYFIIQATHPEATKGEMLRELRAIFGSHLPAIAAGDGGNDISMLQEADIKIVMETAPDFMLKMATIIAPAASKNGIISGLNQAIKLCK